MSIQFALEMCIFVEKPSDEYECGICFNVLNNPRQCSNGHCYCLTCILGIISKKNKCPLCEEVFDQNKLIKSLSLNNLIRNMKTYCISKITGNTDCQWTGPLHYRQIHFETDCEFYYVDCLNFGCSERFQRKYFSEHNAVCSFCQVCCNYCHAVNSTTYSPSQLKLHKPVCTSRPVICTNNCSVTVPFNQLKSHLQTDCRLQLVECPLKALLGVCRSDCPGMLTREAVEAHVVGPDSLYGTILTVVAPFVSVQRSVADLSERIKTLGPLVRKTIVPSVEALTIRCTMLEAENTALVTRLDEQRVAIGGLVVSEKVNTEKVAKLEARAAQSDERTRSLSELNHSLTNRAADVAALVSQLTTQLALAENGLALAAVERFETQKLNSDMFDLLNARLDNVVNRELTATLQMIDDIAAVPPHSKTLQQKVDEKDGAVEENGEQGAGKEVNLLLEVKRELKEEEVAAELESINNDNEADDQCGAVSVAILTDGNVTSHKDHEGVVHQLPHLNITPCTTMPLHAFPPSVLSESTADAAAPVVETSSIMTMPPSELNLSNVVIPDGLSAPSDEFLVQFRAKLNNIYVCCNSVTMNNGLVALFMKNTVELFTQSCHQLYLMYVLLLEPVCGLACVVDHETNRPRLIVTKKGKKGVKKALEDDVRRKMTLATYTRLAEMICEGADPDQVRFKPFMLDLGERSALVKNFNIFIKIQLPSDTGYTTPRNVCIERSPIFSVRIEQLSSRPHYPQDYNIVVQNAVPTVVNGTYIFHKLYDGAGRYRRVGPNINNIETEFFITRWTYTDGHVFEWSIAHFVENDCSYVDYFRLHGTRVGYVPMDSAQWRCVHNKLIGWNCMCVAPTVSVVLIAR